MKTKKRRHHHKSGLLITVIVVLIAAYVYGALSTSLPQLKPAPSTFKANNPLKSELVWPQAEEAAVGVYGTNILETQGLQKVTPTASTAKLITALCVLREKPLVLGQQGPTITLGPADAAMYSTYLSQDGSVVPVVSGEQLSEYSMLEAMLLPSGDNIADSLAIWAFGSLSAYSTYANNYVKSIGLSQTHVGADASGLSPDSTSTAKDLVKLGEATLNSPVLAQIVSEKSASGIPEVGTIKNVNQLLGVDNIIGVKTGNSDQAGGVFIAASTTKVSDQQVTIVTALAKGASLYDAMYDSLPLITSAQGNFADTSVVSAGSVIGYYSLPWGGNALVVSQNALDAESWKGSPVSVSVNLNKIPGNSKANKVVGSITTQKTPFGAAQTSPAVLESAVLKPPLWWRLAHPKGLFSSDFEYHL